MKKILLTFLMCLLAISAKSEIYTYVGTSYAVAKVTRHNNYHWSDWYECDVLIVIDTERKMVGIDSYEPQIYKIYKYEGQIDEDNGFQKVFYVEDIKKDYGQMRIRVLTDSFGNIINVQLYVDFKNVAWVYNIYEILL